LPNAEHLWVDIQADQGPLTAGVIYRHLDDTATGVDNFSEEMNEILLTLNNSKIPYYCVGDFNLNLLKISKKESIRRYKNMLLSCSCTGMFNQFTNPH